MYQDMLNNFNELVKLENSNAFSFRFRVNTLMKSNFYLKIYLEWIRYKVNSVKVDCSRSWVVKDKFK